jgi:hypothetical protein
MKIYIQIYTAPEVLDLTAFCKNHNISREEVGMYGGVYCLDNTNQTVSYLATEEADKIPASFILKWDLKHISDLYENKIIGRFNQGKPQWTLMDAKSIEPMIQVLMYGAKKYDRDNWKKACPKRLDLMDSLQRHAMKIIDGESVDPESGLPHIGHLMCNAMFYSYWEQKTNGLFENFESTK